jgi:hypothetical protein
MHVSWVVTFAVAAIIAVGGSSLYRLSSRQNTAAGPTATTSLRSIFIGVASALLALLALLMLAATAASLSERMVRDPRPDSARHTEAPEPSVP